VRVRQAVMYATDYEMYNSIAFDNMGQRIGPLGWLLDWTLPLEELPKTDIAKAKQLLTEAGYPDGFKVTAQEAVFAAGTSFFPLFKAQLAKIGIDVSAEVLETAEWMRRVYSRGGDFTCSVHGHYGYADPDQYLSPFLTTTGPENNTGYSNPKLDELIAKQRAEMDPVKRKEILYEVQRILFAESPYVYVTGYAATGLRHPYFKGGGTEVLGVYFGGEWEYVWLDK